ncbi:hypothetical protein GXW78_21750 [Roseomonas terrae]|uniref:Uncharacterized protein n=1 Tax=Neoroseomonas terrae TaxID=424799 RepID=A0ABS5EMP7_9PROT|nr:hypothetical protein [Neoroseomonas terrae]MBR0652296.1 hypothetical protein [Neoroseomonas terrae]
MREAIGRDLGAIHGVRREDAAAILDELADITPGQLAAKAGSLAALIKADQAAWRAAFRAPFRAP